jgi:hypothetical protein
MVDEDAFEQVPTVKAVSDFIVDLPKLPTGTPSAPFYFQVVFWVAHLGEAPPPQEDSSTPVRIPCFLVDAAGIPVRCFVFAGSQAWKQLVAVTKRDDYCAQLVMSCVRLVSIQKSERDNYQVKELQAFGTATFYLEASPASIVQCVSRDVVNPKNPFSDPFDKAFAPLPLLVKERREGTSVKAGGAQYLILKGLAPVDGRIGTVEIMLFVNKQWQSDAWAIVKPGIPVVISGLRPKEINPMFSHMGIDRQFQGMTYSTVQHGGRFLGATAEKLIASASRFSLSGVGQVTPSGQIAPVAPTIGEEIPLDDEEEEEDLYSKPTKGRRIG